MDVCFIEVFAEYLPLHRKWTHAKWHTYWSMSSTSYVYIYIAQFELFCMSKLWIISRWDTTFHQSLYEIVACSENEKKKSEVVKVNKKYLTRLLKRSRIKRYSESYSSRRMPVFNVDSPVEYYTLSTSRNILNETVYMSISYVIRATVHLKVNSLLIAVPYIHIELVPCANQNVHVQLVV